jgi:hypothetical protein
MRDESDSTPAAELKDLHFRPSWWVRDHNPQAGRDKNRQAVFSSLRWASIDRAGRQN